MRRAGATRPQDNANYPRSSELKLIPETTRFTWPSSLFLCPADRKLCIASSNSELYHLPSAAAPPPRRRRCIGRPSQSSGTQPARERRDSQQRTGPVQPELALDLSYHHTAHTAGRTRSAARPFSFPAALTSSHSATERSGIQGRSTDADGERNQPCQEADGTIPSGRIYKTLSRRRREKTPLQVFARCSVSSSLPNLALSLQRFDLVALRERNAFVFSRHAAPYAYTVCFWLWIRIELSQKVNDGS